MYKYGCGYVSIIICFYGHNSINSSMRGKEWSYITRWIGQTITRNKTQNMSCPYYIDINGLCTRITYHHPGTRYQVIYCFVVQVYPSNCRVIILYDVGGGFHWRDTRAAVPAAASHLLSYCQNPGVPPPQPTGRGTNTRSLWRPRPPMVANHWQPKPLTLPILLVGPESLPISRKQ